jgi:hypothetical protein
VGTPTASAQFQLPTGTSRELFTHESRLFWHAETVNNREPLRAAFLEATPRHTWAAVEAAFNGDLSIIDLIDTHGAAAVCESPPVWGLTYRRTPIIQQEVLVSHDDLDWLRKRPWGLDDAHAESWTDALAATLPLAPTPWARLSRLPWWDMDITDPANTTPPGTAAFGILVLCACLHWEARVLLRRRGHPDLGPEPLPSWIRLPPSHPVSVVITGAAKRRYDPDAARPLVIPDNWLPPRRSDVRRSLGIRAHQPSGLGLRSIRPVLRRCPQFIGARR